MQNPSTFRMQFQNVNSTYPTIIPITSSLLYSMPHSAYVYKIGRPDTLNVSIWQHPEFDRPVQSVNTLSTSNASSTNIIPAQFNYSINSSGNIYFPLVGYVQVENKTVDQVRYELSKKLRTYIRQPQVNVSIAEYRSKKVYIIGEINKPGLLYLNNEPMSIMDALMLSGSIDLNTGDPRFIYVVRGNIECPIIYWLNGTTPDRLILAEKFRLQNNDIIYVSAAVVTRWNRFLSQLLPTVQTIWFTKSITGK